MSEKSRYYVLKNGFPDEDGVQEMLDDVTDAFAGAGAEIVAYDNLDRLVVVIPDSFPKARTNQVFDDMGHEVEDMWDSSGPSGKILNVDLFYHDEQQSVFGSVDEGLLLAALKGTDPMDRDLRMKCAITALAGDNEFTFGYGPLNNNLSIRDITSSVSFWDADAALKWNPISWDPDEPMLDVSFVPQADLAGTDTIVPVSVNGMQTTWSMPVRLLPEEFNIDDDYARDELARLPCAPEMVQTWASIMPFEVNVDRMDPSPQTDSPGL